MFLTVLLTVQPGEPEIIVPDIEASYIRLKWNPPSSNGGSRVLDYKVTVKDEDKQRTITGNQTLFDKLKPGWSYTFILSARNIVGYGKAVSRTFKTTIIGTL